MAGCSRRDLLRGLGVLALPLPLGVLMEACGGSAGPQGGTVSACGAKMCMDLTVAANAPLQNTGGSVQINGSNGDVLIVIRMSATTVVALSAVCTHAGCLVEVGASNTVVCPCHGSVFGEDGHVEQGPARAPLTRYAATLSGTQLTIG
jgi:Rieske Fe-S protein